ncbi:MAG: hypothetical protein KAH32_07215 [Chlamydiia bacterium]|nr:hypothetical protein [Chlamydiia bacterium]
MAINTYITCEGKVIECDSNNKDDVYWNEVMCGYKKLTIEQVNKELKTRRNDSTEAFLSKFTNKESNAGC